MCLGPYGDSSRQLVKNMGAQDFDRLSLSFQKVIKIRMGLGTAFQGTLGIIVQCCALMMYAIKK